MSILLPYASCSAAVLLAGAGLYCLCRAMLSRRRVFLHAFSGMRRGNVAVLLALAAVATIEAQKGGGGNSPAAGGGEAEATDGEPGEPHSAASEVTDLCFTGISASTNGVELSLAWPTNSLFAGDIVDVFAATSLVGAAWGWVAEHELATGTETGWTAIVDPAAVAGGAHPPAMFFSASVRADPGDLRDTDGDTLPDAYEMRNGGNPYVPDHAAVQKLTVGPSGMYADIASALAASADYSIIELDPAFVHDAVSAVRVPARPVMVCSPPGTRAVVRATGMSAFLLDTDVTSRTLFKGLHVLLDARSDFQAGFWIGGNLPWNPVRASATFEDVYIRMPHPGVEHFGWLLYSSSAEAVTLSRCTVNAAGSEWTYGVQTFGTAPLVLDRCTFVNFPSNLTGRSCGILTRSSPDAGGGADVSVSRTVFDESFTNAIMVGRLEEGASNVLSVVNCIVPRELPSAFPVELASGVVVTGAALSWAGFPWPDSPAVALGMGALPPVADDPAADMDGDGLCDFGEAYVYDTDPFLADTDRDGVSDGDEVGQGTDPADPHSFLQNLTVTVTNTASPSHAAYVTYGNSSDTWETGGLAAFPSGFGSTVYTNASANGAAYVKAFCDLDGDGECSAATDILLVRPIPQGAVANVPFRFGDVDGDGVDDAQERADGTDPYDGKNFKVNLSGRFEGVFRTTNCLFAVVRMNAEIAFGPVAMTNRTWQFGPQSIVAVTGGRPEFLFWDDANSNGVCDVSETQVSYTPLPVSHDMAFTNRLSYGAFDRDDDGMLDWWEVQHGLSPTNAVDAVADMDGDGLINLHEFWCDTEPLVPDGSNTLLSVMSRSIDDRIRDIDPATAVPLFTDYFINGTNGIFLANTNFWARDLDLSCVSVWNNGPYPESQPATLITRKHVVLANHWNNYNGQYTFCDTNGQVCVRTFIQKEVIYKDLLLGRLDAPLPDSFRPASVMSTNFANYLSTGQYLPTLCVNQEKCATVLEVEGLDTETIDVRGIRYVHYGMNSHTNVVSTQRCAVRSVTYGGSSGCPVFAVVGDEPILLFAKHLGYQNEGTWSPFWGPMISFHLDTIQGKINTWEGDDANLYQIIPFDLNPFEGVTNP